MGVSTLNTSSNYYYYNYYTNGSNVVKPKDTLSSVRTSDLVYRGSGRFFLGETRLLVSIEKLKGTRLRVPGLFGTEVN